MPQIIYQDTILDIDGAESVLETLEKAGFKIPFSCRSGLCHSCMMQADESPPISSQQGLNDSQKLQHFFLACSCFPEQDMRVNRAGETDHISGLIVDKKLLNSTVQGITLQADCRWFPGQYITVWYDDVQGRSYSIASRCTTEKKLELHVKRHDQGLVSRWLHDEVNVGDTLTLSKPMGHCFYTDEHSDKPLLMVSTGTGLAPLYGILQEALFRNHNAPIYLYTAAGEIEGLYYQDELQSLAQQYTNFNYIPCVRRQGSDEVIEQDVIPLVKEQHTDLAGWKVFLCGSAEMIKQLQRHCFFQGAKVTDILVDIFNKEGP